MALKATELIGKKVYTPSGFLLGEVSNLVLNLTLRKVDGLFIDWTDPRLVEDSLAVNVPFRWIQAIGDVIILHKFPEWVGADEENCRSDL
ncbi:MAG: hypothetical protein PWQ88_843 [Candidatus Methanomethylophilaceae archaeon]|nr:hypothetical protein [Candidatus Methanomethylophilaceae archaeon]MDI3541239.1 hypothetical protein [Candidatus Methanomethylophilaceae archaeon]HIJ00721.1 photosystem reaction center subunit H [Candidatus Methanomethylophilaceae archaeon]